jgi:hypothetical protein
MRASPLGTSDVTLRFAPWARTAAMMSSCKRGLALRGSMKSSAGDEAPSVCSSNRVIPWNARSDTNLALDDSFVETDTDGNEQCGSRRCSRRPRSHRSITGEMRVGASCACDATPAVRCRGATAAHPAVRCSSATAGARTVRELSADPECPQLTHVRGRLFRARMGSLESSRRFACPFLPSVTRVLRGRTVVHQSEKQT